VLGSQPVVREHEDITVREVPTRGIEIAAQDARPLVAAGQVRRNRLVGADMPAVRRIADSVRPLSVTEMGPYAAGRGASRASPPVRLAPQSDAQCATMATVQTTGNFAPRAERSEGPRDE